MVIMMTKGALVRARNTYDGKPAINVGVIIEKEAISMPPALIVHDKTCLQSQTDTNLHVPTVLPTVSFPFWPSQCEIFMLFSQEMLGRALAAWDG